jgi:lipoprotein-releasing system ATP-binding protein
MNDAIFSCENVSKTYYDGSDTVNVLNKINFKIHAGNKIAIIGPSGSGKSTLLHLLGGLDNPTQGEVFLHNKSWKSLSEKNRCQLRNQQLGFIYQFHHLLPEFTATENVALPLLLANISAKSAETQALKILEQVGLANRVTHKPAQLSGGERQRVAIARALVNKPSCVLADEPTGNLDQATASKVFDLMLELNAIFNTALVIVTHDKELADRMDTVLTIKDGTLGEQSL